MSQLRIGAWDAPHGYKKDDQLTVRFIEETSYPRKTFRVGDMLIGRVVFVYDDSLELDGQDGQTYVVHLGDVTVERCT